MAGCMLRQFGNMIHVKLTTVGSKYSKKNKNVVNMYKRADTGTWLWDLLKEEEESKDGK